MGARGQDSYSCSGGTQQRWGYETSDHAFCLCFAEAGGHGMSQFEYRGGVHETVSS